MVDSLLRRAGQSWLCVLFVGDTDEMRETKKVTDGCDPGALWQMESLVSRFHGQAVALTSYTEAPLRRERPGTQQCSRAQDVSSGK